MSVFKEFRDFAIKGNVVDLAVAVVIGAAFGKIVTSVVEDIVMPLIAKIVGDIDFSNMYVFLGSEEKLAKALETANTSTLALAEAKKLGPVLAYGNFITIIINFIIIAIAIFIVVKLINTAKDKAAALAKKEAEEVKEEAPKGPSQEELLAEIRDLLKKKA